MLSKISCAEIVERCGRCQAIGVEVIDRQSALIFLHEYEGRTGDEPAIGDTQPFGDSPDEMRLAGAERADQRDDGAREEQRSETAAERFRGGEIGKVEGHADMIPAVEDESVRWTWTKCIVACIDVLLYLVFMLRMGWVFVRKLL